ncbi:MAG: glycoside hydrolase family 32 protein [Demequina sp.]|uniref:glycoside hydrolase family 32 protein n=1 Tax=Demequina sp. TaxID=2050685 RepID=UPI003A88FB56
MSPSTPVAESIPRPRHHFTPSRNWMNDPNGLVFHGGRWHMFFQYNPFGADWGNMSWGHASSADLRAWTEHPVALACRPGEQVYSGSAVSLPNGDLVAYYTSNYDDAHQAQSMAVSHDDGMTWERYAGNPVVDRGTASFRDPKVVRFRDAGGRERWIMLAVEADQHQVHFYGSDDLVAWEHLSVFGPLGATEGLVWECPDLITLDVDGDPENTRFVLVVSTNEVGEPARGGGSRMGYVLGSFDGVEFSTTDTGWTPLDYGRDFYAGVTFDSAPGSEPVMLGWMSNWRYAERVPSSPWRGAMSLPRRLALRTIAGAVRLVQSPPEWWEKELGSAWRQVVDGTGAATVSGSVACEVSWGPGAAGEFSLHLTGVDGAVATVACDAGRTVTVSRAGGLMDEVHADFPSSVTVDLPPGTDPRIVVALDGPLLEVFAADGAVVVSHQVFFGTSVVEAVLTSTGPVVVAVATVADASGADHA